MAAEFQVGTVSAPTSAGGTVNISLGFEVKILYVWTILKITYNTFTAEAFYGCGFGSGPNPQPQRFFTFANRWYNLFNSQVSASNNSFSNLIVLYSGHNYSSFPRLVLGISSVTATDVVLTTTQTDGGAYKVDYLAIGGSGITVGFSSSGAEPTTPTSTGNVSYAHGLGASPTFVQVISSISSSDQGHHYANGFTDGVNQAVTLNYTNGTTLGIGVGNPSLNKGYQRTDKIIAVPNSSTGAIIAEAEFVSWDSTNFTLNWTTVHTSGMKFAWFAITGVTAQVGSFSQPASTTGPVSYPLIIDPIVMMFQSAGQVSGTSLTDNNRFSVGVTDGAAGNQKGMWLGSNTGATSAATLNSVNGFIDTGALFSADPSGGTSGTARARGEVSLGAASFDVDWLQADAVEREWVFAAFGFEAAGEEFDMTMEGGIEFNGAAVRAGRTGLHFIDVGKRNDEYFPGLQTAIPNPYIETALEPDEDM